MKYFPIFFALTMAVYADEAPIVNLHTNFGLIVLELNSEKAPKTVATFLKYANSNFYDDTVFHRVIKKYIVQGGGYTKDYRKKIPLYDPIVNESNNGLENLAGTIAMARSYRDPDSATCQFFINLKDNISLDYNDITEEMGYTVFGKVIEGMDVVEKIQYLKTGPKGPLKKNVPQTPVIIEVVVVKNTTSSTELPAIVDEETNTDDTDIISSEELPDTSEQVVDVIDDVVSAKKLSNDKEKLAVEDDITQELTDDIDSNEDNIEHELVKNDVTDVDEYIDKIIKPKILPKLDFFQIQIPAFEFKAEKIPINIIHEKIPTKPKFLSAPDMPSQPDLPDSIPY